MGRFFRSLIATISATLCLLALVAWALAPWLGLDGRGVPLEFRHPVDHPADAEPATQVQWLGFAFTRGFMREPLSVSIPQTGPDAAPSDALYRLTRLRIPLWFIALFSAELWYFTSLRRKLRCWRRLLCMGCGAELEPKDTRCPACARPVLGPLRSAGQWGLGLLALLSLAACLFVAGMWVRGHYTRNWKTGDWTSTTRFESRDGLIFGDSLFFRASAGQMGFGRILTQSPAGMDYSQAEHESAREMFVVAYGRTMVAQPPTSLFRQAGFAFARGAGGRGQTVYRHWWISLPYWFLVLLAAPLPAWWLQRAWRQRRTRQRIRHGRCIRCGYDLRASRSWCPECGEAVPDLLARLPVEKIPADSPGPAAQDHPATGR